MPEHRLRVSGRAFAKQKWDRSFSPLDAAAYAGMIAENYFMIADMLQECVLVLFRKQSASCCEAFRLLKDDTLCEEYLREWQEKQ